MISLWNQRLQPDDNLGKCFYQRFYIQEMEIT